jgi:Winged helix DNA-binding domain
MPRSLSEDQVRLLRLRSQRLTGDRPGDVHEVVRVMGGIQAQDTAASRLAVRPRGVGLDAGAVRHACNRERSLVRTWAMRGTLHMVAAEDVGWLVALLGPAFAAANRRRRLQLGLDDDQSARGLRAIGKALAGGPLPRGELVSRLAGEGVVLDPRSQAPAHLVGYAAMQGLVCRGPDLGHDEPTYVLLDDWLGGRPPALEPDAALAELTRRYLGAHAPATPADLAAWAGIAAGRARRGFQLVAGELVEVEAAGAPAWTLAGGTPPRPWRGGPCVRLLYRFDDYLLGWRGRDLVLSPRFARRIQAGGGWIHPAVVVDGRVVGTWRLAAKAGDRLTVTVEPFEPLDGALPGLEAEAADLGRFLAATAALSVARPVPPARR